jgi:hypothetical protein
LFNVNLSGELKQKQIRIHQEYNNDKPYSDFLQLMRLSYSGRTLLTISEFNQLNIFKIDSNLLHLCQYYLPQSSNMNPLPSDVTSCTYLPESSIACGESIYDIRFFPSDAAFDGDQFVIFSSKDHPIHFYNLSSNQVIASYRPHNHLDELTNIYTLNYNTYFDKLIAGSNSHLYIFDIQNPHILLSQFSTNKESASSKPSPFQTKGIISAIEANPDSSGIIAVGTLSSDISLYDERLLGKSCKESSLLTVKNLSSTGIVQLKWSADGNYLYVNCRKHNFIYCYDIRHQKKCIGKFYRRSDLNNQKMIMDIDPWGQYLVTGNQIQSEQSTASDNSSLLDKNPILVYDTNSFELVNSFNPFEDELSRTVHTTIFHPFYSILLTATGERAFPAFSADGSSSDSDDNEPNRKRQRVGKPQTQRNTRSELCAWSLPKTQLYLEESVEQPAASQLTTEQEIPVVTNN